MTELAASLVSLARVGAGVAMLHDGARSYGGADIHDPVRFDGLELQTSIRLAASPQSLATVSADLLTASLVAADLFAIGSVNANLNTQIRLAASLSVTAEAEGNLATAITMAAGLDADASQDASLSTAILLAAGLDGQAEISSNLATQILAGASLASEASVAASLDTSIRLASSLTAEASASASELFVVRPIASALAAEAEISASLATQTLFSASLQADASLEPALDTSIRLAASLSTTSTASASLLTSIRLAAQLLSVSTVTPFLEGATWSDEEGEILALTKGAPINKTIFAQLIPASGPQVYTVVANGLPPSVVVTVTPSGVTLSGDTSGFLPPEDIFYRDGLGFGQTPNPAAVPPGASPYQWLASTATDETRSITIMVSNSTLSDVRTFEILVANNWDAHRAALLNLLETV